MNESSVKKHFQINPDKRYMTVKEVMILWDKTRFSVDNAIQKEHLYARQTVWGSTWIIDALSVIEHWGLPNSEKWGEYHVS